MIFEVFKGNYKTDFEYHLDKKVVGYIRVEDTIDVINIIDVFVESEYRQKGIASELLRYIFNKYGNRNVRYMLEVRENNIAAINLYKKFGFKVINIRDKYYKEENALIMEAKK